MNRRGLISVVALLGVVLTTGLMYVLVSSLRPSHRAHALGGTTIDVGVVAAGEFRRFGTPKGPVFVFRPTEQTWKDLRAFDSEVQDARITNYYPKLGVFIYYGNSTRLGCVLKGRTKDDPIVTSSQPKWPGGYVDVCHGARYDYAGRAERIGVPYAALNPVRIQWTDGTRIEVDLFGGS